ncbi:MAG: hypothetical protein ACJAS3_000207 [Roseivirga sp.]|jgi:hypothetical protein
MLRQIKVGKEVVVKAVVNTIELADYLSISMSVVGKLNT